MRDDERLLWQHGSFSCVMLSCCSGAELQIRENLQTTGDEEVVLRELYPSKSDLYERAHELASLYSTLAVNLRT